MSNNHRSWKKRVEDKLYDHPILKSAVFNGWNVLILTFSAFILAIGYKCFLVPNQLIADSGGKVTKLVSGGMSGISQTIIMLLSLFLSHDILTAQVENILFSVLYFALNIPIFILAWKGIGKRFTIYTFLNVILVSVFEALLSVWDNGWIHDLAVFANNNGGLLARAIFAGVCTGLSSGFAFKVDGSGGGIDVVAYYVALKKNVLVGRYSLIMNSVTLVVFTLLGSIQIWNSGTGNSMQYIGGACYSILYMMSTSMVIDVIHLRNKKMKIEVVTDHEDLGKILIANLPHAATIVKGEGAYSGKGRYLIKMVVSSYEVNHAVAVIESADPNAFIEVVELKQVYGRFFLPPIK